MRYLILGEIFCSDEKYLQFQVDGNLQYQCATCRGECYQVCLLQKSLSSLLVCSHVACLACCSDQVPFLLLKCLLPGEGS